MRSKVCMLIPPVTPEMTATEKNGRDGGDARAQERPYPL